MFRFDVLFDDDRIGYLGWDKRADREKSTCVAGMNPEQDCQYSFTLPHMLNSVDIEEGYPSAVLHGIEIETSHQRNGHGSNALKLFENHAIDEGCHFAMCNIGFDSEDDMRRNVAFYEFNDYKIFCHNGGVECEVIPPEGTYWLCAFKALNIPKHMIDTRRLTLQNEVAEQAPALKQNRTSVSGNLDSFWDCGSVE